MRLDEITGTLNKDDFSTYSAAVDYARLQASKRGYTVSDDVWHNEITVGSGPLPKAKLLGTILN